MIQNPSTPPERLIARHDVAFSKSPEGWDMFSVAPTVDTARARIFYLHGGAFVWHMVDAHWEFIDDLVSQTAAEVLIPAYPLAPYPDAPDRCGNALTVLPQVAELLGSTMKDSDLPTILMGDSAGGNIATAALMIQREWCRQLPSRTVLLSPWLDLVFRQREIADINAPRMSVDLLKRDAEAWRGTLSLDSSLVSPVNGQLHGLGRIAVFCGTADVVYPGCQRFVQKAANAERTNMTAYLHDDEPHNHLIKGTPVGIEARQKLYDLIRTG